MNLMLVGAVVAVSGWAGTLRAAESRMECKLDGLMTFPQVWEMTPDQLEKDFGGADGKLMKWLTKDKTRAKFSRKLYSNAEIDLKTLDGVVPLEEAVVDFADGKVNVVTFSVFNRGDGGEITKEEFEKRFKACGAGMSKALVAKPSVTKADRQQGLLSEGYRWASPAGIAVLEYNEGALVDQPREFLRLRVSRKGAAGGLAAAMLASRGGAAVKLSDLPKNVVKEEDGSVLVTGLPMVDQGNKGYCVVASVQRLFEYFGIGADMHQIAAVSGADPEKGTSTMAMAQELDKIDYRFKTRLKILGMTAQRGGFVQVERDFVVGRPIDEAAFMKMVRTYVNNGLPLLWSLELGLFKEEPDLNPQAAGGHMRIITGYNDKDQSIIFSDSWGAGHERKRMNMSEGYQATRGLFALQPTLR
jgi:hypothetical protein